MKKIILVFILLIIIFSTGCNHHINEGLKPGDFGYKVYHGPNITFTYINDSIVIYHVYNRPIINIKTGRVVDYANGSTGKMKVKGDDNTVTIN